MNQSEKNRLVDFLAKNSCDSYYAFMNKSKKRDWEPLFTAYAKLVVEAFDNTDRYEKVRMRNCLLGKGQFFEPMLEEGLDQFNQSHNVLKRRRSSGHPIPLLELLLIGHDLEYFVRPGLLRIDWAAMNSVQYKKRYTDVMLKDMRIEVNGKKSVKYNSRSIFNATKDLKKWLSTAPSALLTRNELHCMDVFIASVSKKRGRVLSPDELRNWIAHRDFLFRGSYVIFNLNNGTAKRKTLTQKDIKSIMEDNLQLCTIVIFLNYIFLWCATHILNKMSLVDIKTSLGLSYMPP